MEHNILQYFNQINEGFLHPKGKIASDFLLEELALKNGDTVLELGFGTGASLVKTFSKNTSIHFYGAENSSLMLEKARLRLRFCGLEKQITLKTLLEDKSIPFESNFFDKIYVESVLAIQEDEQLHKMIAELNRVLKPNGILCINELVWMSETKQQDVDFINDFTKEKFGIILANGKYKSIENWISLLERYSFTVDKVHNIDTLSEIGNKFPKTFSEFLSNLFSLKGKIKGKFSPKLIKQWSNYENEMKRLEQTKKLEPYIITTHKNHGSD